MMDSKTRAKLRSYANTVEAILQVGKNGMGEALQKQVDDALTAGSLQADGAGDRETPQGDGGDPGGEPPAPRWCRWWAAKVTLYRKNPEKDHH